MDHDHVRGAISAAKTTNQLDELGRIIWRAYGNGEIGEGTAATLSEAIETARRSFGTPRRTPQGTPRGFAPPRRYPARDRHRSLERRRRLAASGPMPPTLACNFTTGELAVLRIVADEGRDKGQCDRSLGELAARAGVGRTTAQNAIRRAASLGLVTVQERRQEGRRNLPNVVAVVSKEWLLWIDRGRGGQGIGFKKPHPTDSIYISGKKRRREPLELDLRARCENKLLGAYLALNDETPPDQGGARINQCLAGRSGQSAN